MIDPSPIAPGTLSERLARTVALALEQGALQPVATQATEIADGGVRFLVRMVDSLARKEAQRARPGVAGAAGQPPADPFLPPEPALAVGTVCGTHVAVLNKFNVLPSHLLLVTRRFAPQESLLSAADLGALGCCLRDLDGLGFYNGGTAAGASQPHKHLQLVPLPLAHGGAGVPMESLLPVRERGPAPRPPFAHAFAPIDVRSAEPTALHGLYLRLIEGIGIRTLTIDGVPHQSAPYNLLVARGWMLAVPRVRERVVGVSINGLAFAGSLFVKDRAQLEAVRRAGPMAILRAAAGDAGPCAPGIEPLPPA